MNNRKLNTHLSQSDIALQIESLVQAIEHSDTPAFRITHSRLALVIREWILFGY